MRDLLWVPLQIPGAPGGYGFSKCKRTLENLHEALRNEACKANRIGTPGTLLDTPSDAPIVLPV